MKSVLIVTCDYGLPKFLTKRDARARPFDGLFQKASKARSDTPATLPRVPLPKITVPKSDPAHPANQPLDETQKEILRGVHGLTASANPQGPAIDPLPKTPGVASDPSRKRYRQHFGRK